MHAELFDDVLKTIIAVATLAAVALGARNHVKLKVIDRAVNGSTNPDEKTLRENVQELHNDAQVIKETVTAAPPEGQVG